MDVGSAYRLSAQGSFDVVAGKCRVEEDDELLRAASELRRRIGDAELAAATVRVLGVMAEDGITSMMTAQRVRPAAWFYLGAMRCESPLEVVMLSGLMAAAWMWTGGVIVRVPAYDVGHVRNGSTGRELCIIEPQAHIGGHRVDFHLEHRLEYCASGRVDGPTSWSVARHMVVECGGHAFHERTKQQVARDRARDRRLQKSILGALVFHYAGSEIWADPCRCAVEAVQTLWRVTHKAFAAHLATVEGDA